MEESYRTEYRTNKLSKSSSVSNENLTTTTTTIQQITVPTFSPDPDTNQCTGLVLFSHRLPMTNRSVPFFPAVTTNKTSHHQPQQQQQNILLIIQDWQCNFTTYMFSQNCSSNVLTRKSQSRFTLSPLCYK